MRERGWMLSCSKCNRRRYGGAPLGVYEVGSEVIALTGPGCRCGWRTATVRARASWTRHGFEWCRERLRYVLSGEWLRRASYVSREHRIEHSRWVDEDRHDSGIGWREALARWIWS